MSVWSSATTTPINLDATDITHLAMKPWIKIMLTTCLAALVWTILPHNLAANAAVRHDIQGEFTAQGVPQPITDDYGSVFNAPAQIPALAPNQSPRLVTLAKNRVSLMRTNILRRNINRLSNSFYTPIAAAGRLTVERMSAPLRHLRVIHFYVLELCRLLC